MVTPKSPAQTRTYLEVLCDLTDETLEGQLADEQLRRLLVATNFTEGDGTRPEAMRLLDTTGSGLRTGRVSRVIHQG